MDSREVGRRILARAAAKLGGTAELASHVGVSHRLLQHYLTGSDPVPDVLFLRLLDVILENSPSAFSDGA